MALYLDISLICYYHISFTNARNKGVVMSDKHTSITGYTRPRHLSVVVTNVTSSSHQKAGKCPNSQQYCIFGKKNNEANTVAENSVAHISTKERELPLPIPYFFIASRPSLHCLLYYCCVIVVGCSDDEFSVVKVLFTGVAAAIASLAWYSGYLPGIGHNVSLNVNTISALLALGIIIALPLDRLIR